MAKAPQQPKDDGDEQPARAKRKYTKRGTKLLKPGSIPPVSGEQLHQADGQPLKSARDRRAEEQSQRMRLEWCDDYAEIVRRGAMLGLDIEGLRALLGVSRVVLDRWRSESPAFDAAILEGRAVADSRVANAMYRAATGYDYLEQRPFKFGGKGEPERIELAEVRVHAQPNVTAAIFWLSNRHPTLWKRMPEAAAAEQDNTITGIKIEVQHRNKPADGDDGEAKA